MDHTIRNAMTSGSSSSRAQRIGSSSQYITDTNFLNLLQNIDINNPKKFNYGLFAAFNSVPGLKDQVQKWLQNS